MARKAAFDIERAREVEALGPEADDTDIWRYAVTHDRIVLTNDCHFVDGTADPGEGTHPGVIRYVAYDWAAIADAIETLTNTEDIVGGTALFVPGEWNE